MENSLQELSFKTPFKNSLQEHFLGEFSLSTFVEKFEGKLKRYKNCLPSCKVRARRKIQIWTGNRQIKRNCQIQKTKEKRVTGMYEFFILEGHWIGNRTPHARPNRHYFPVWGCWLAFSPPQPPIIISLNSKYIGSVGRLK